MVALQSYFSNPSLLSALLQVKMKREMQTWGWETAQMLVPNCPNRLQVVHFECPGPWKPWISSNKAVIAFLVLLFYSIAMLPLLFTMTAVMVALKSYRFHLPFLKSRWKGICRYETGETAQILVPNWPTECEWSSLNATGHKSSESLLIRLYFLSLLE